MTRVLVSGGTGFVGRFIVEHLLANGYDVTVGGRSQPAEGFFSRPVSYAPLRLDPDADQIAAFDDVSCFVHAAFEHVAGRYRGGEGTDPEGFRRANLDGSLRLFEEARAVGVRRCVFLSSRAVYGMTSSPVLEQFQQKCAAVLRLELRKNKEIERFRDSEKSGNALDETTPPEPETLYGQVKLAAEEALKALATPGFVTASLRVTGVYGPAGPGRLHKWAGLFADYLAGGPVPPRIGTEVHGDDVAQAVRLMLEADAANVSGKVFNVSDVLTDSREILAIFQSATGCPHALPQAADPTAFKVMSTKRLRALGWMPGGRDRLAATIRELARDAR